MAVSQPSTSHRIFIMVLLMLLLYVLMRDVLFRKDPVIQLVTLHHRIQQDQDRIKNIREENHGLEKIVRHLHRHDEILEREARYVGGLVKPNEKFYQLAPRKTG